MNDVLRLRIRWVLWPLSFFVGMLLMWGISKDESHTQADVPVHSLPTRPHTWFKKIIATHPSPEEVTAFENDILAIKPRLGKGFPPRIPISDPVLLDKLNRAREALIAQETDRALWHADAVMALVRRSGTDLPFLVPPRKGHAGTVVYSFLQDGLYITPGVVDLPDLQIRQMLLHEMTHAEVRRVTLEMSGYSVDEHLAAGERCQDLHDLSAFVTEALAFRNEALWLSRQEGADESFRADPNGIQFHALQNERGIAGARNQFASDILLYVFLNKGADTGKHLRDIQQQHCHPPIILHGPRRGEYVYPTDIAPDILIPLVEAVKL